MNCFQISIFAVANTTKWRLPLIRCLLWIAFKLVSLQLQTQLDGATNLIPSVVNCFQISIFAVANTTPFEDLKVHHKLWIAFKLVSLQLQTQRRNNQHYLLLVVNCFQISIFAVANTTLEIGIVCARELWIAFKLVSLQLQTQRLFFTALLHKCCELLSN